MRADDSNIWRWFTYISAYCFCANCFIRYKSRSISTTLNNLFKWNNMLFFKQDLQNLKNRRNIKNIIYNLIKKIFLRISFQDSQKFFWFWFFRSWRFCLKNKTLFYLNKSRKILFFYRWIRYFVIILFFKFPAISSVVELVS